MELLIVVGILGILAAVVVVSVVGLLGRGQKEGYEVDQKTIQTAVSAFYADSHAYSATNGGWNAAGDYTSMHNFPTGNATYSGLYLVDAPPLGRYQVKIVWDPIDNEEADLDDIQKAAIWMSLLTKGPGEVAAGPQDDTPPYEALNDSQTNSPLARENGPYLNPLPDSCSRNNSPKGKGSYTWIVADNGRVYGVFPQGEFWYAGYGGHYP